MPVEVAGMQKTFTKLTVELGDELSLWLQELAKEKGMTKVELVRRIFGMSLAIEEEKLPADQRELVKAARNDEILNDLEFLRGRSVRVARIL